MSNQNLNQKEKDLNNFEKEKIKTLEKTLLNENKKEKTLNKKLIYNNNSPEKNKCLIIIIIFLISFIIKIYFQKETNDHIKYKIYNEKLKKPIIGIDFGSSFSKFSILLKRSGKEIEDNYFFTSEIVLKRKTEEVEEIGKDSIYIFERNMNDFIYFQNIKINLDPKNGKTNPEKNEIIYSNFPKKYSIQLQTVIKEYLKKISNIALKTLNNKSTLNNFSKDDIKWVVTVPAIWNEYGKQLMRECARNAGMKDISISLEPEAASLAMFDDPQIDDNLKKKDKIFMLVDAGGYTVDITLNQIVDEDGNLRQLSPPSGGSFGSMNVNMEIFKLFEEIFGKEKMETFQKNQFDKWIMLRNEIEEKKIAACVYNSDNSYFRFENIFKDLYSYRYNLDSKYGTIQCDNNYIYIPNSIIKQIIFNQVDKIINHIQILFNKFNKIKIDQIIITGGFSNCNILKYKIINSFRQTVITQLNNPERSIVKGAALFGLKPNQIISRISPYTIGLDSYFSQIEGYECRNKIEIKNRIECRYFNTFIKKGDEVKNNFKIVKYYIPLEDQQEGMSFILYYSDNLNPVYIDEKGVKEIASFDIEAKETNFPREKREFKVEMEFSSCITVKATNVISGKEVSITANYYNRD